VMEPTRFYVSSGIGDAKKQVKASRAVNVADYECHLNESVIEAGLGAILKLLFSKQGIVIDDPRSANSILRKGIVFHGDDAEMYDILSTEKRKLDVMQGEKKLGTFSWSTNRGTIPHGTAVQLAGAGAAGGVLALLGAHQLYKRRSGERSRRRR